MNLPEKLETALKQPHTWSTQAARELISELSEIKRAAVHAGDEVGAKLLWTREQIVEAHVFYRLAFEQLKQREYYNGWCTLERCEIVLRAVRRHLTDADWEIFRLGFVATHVERWQSLFPYKIFFSPEIIQHDKRCSICNSPVGLRSRCGHRKGEIYGGEMCLHVIHKPEFIGIALVDKPVQKYSVLFPIDNTTGKNLDRNQYLPVRYTIDRLASPYDGWEPHVGKRRHPHERYAHVPPTDPCPCESERSYADCCLKEDGVLRPHIDIEFYVPPASDQLFVEYSEMDRPQKGAG